MSKITVKRMAAIMLLCALMIGGTAAADINAGLVAYYCFDDPANLGKDCSPNGNDGTKEGEVTAAAGLIGGAASFGGYFTPGAIHIPNSSSLQFTNDATISFAVNLTGFDGMDAWGNYANYGAHSAIAKSHDRVGFAINVGGNEAGLGTGVASYEWSGAGNSVASDTWPYETGQWRHFAYVFSNSSHTAKLYANGNLVFTLDTFNQSFDSANTQDLYLGKFSDMWFPLNGQLDEVRIYNRALTEPEILQLPNVSQPPGLSCTTNTPGLPLDSSACFYDAADNWKNAILKQTGIVVAQASLAGNEGGFCAGNLLWLDPAGRPISDWAGLFGGLNTTRFDVYAERADGTTRLLGSLPASRSQFGVNVTADQTFPMSGPQAIATFTAAPSSGTAPYTYAWSEVLDYLFGYGDNDWGSAASATIELPAYGEKYPSYPARWGARNSLHLINLRVTDSAGQVSTVQCLAAVTGPHLNGNPALSGSGSQLVRGVDVASGNYHLSATDLSVSGKGPDFVLTRAYNSNVKGYGAWTYNLDLRLYFAWHSMGREIVVGPREDGRVQHYYRELDNTWRALNPGNFDELKQEADGSFTLYTQGNLLYRFADPQGVGAGRLEAIADRDNNVLRFSHDTANHIISALDASARPYTITRDASGRITRVSDFTGRSFAYILNADGMISSAVDPKGQSTTYNYTTGSARADRLKLVSITDPRGHLQTTIAYDASNPSTGKVMTVTDGAGSAWSYQYGTDAGRQVTLITRPVVNGVNNNLAFVLDDARTRVLERLDSVNAGDYRSRTAFKPTTSRTRIPEAALPVETYRPSNALTTKAYSDDGKGNPIRITDALSRQTAATWGAVAGQSNLTPLASLQRPGVATPTQYATFTPSGKAQTITDPLGQTTQRSYDATGLLTQTINARGLTTGITYDAQGRPVRITDALGNYTETTYDPAGLGRRISERDARGQVTRYTYDANGNLLTTTNPAGGVTTNTYDAADNLITTTDPRGNTTTYVYDAISRKVEERYTIGGQQGVRSFMYDAMGRLAQVTNENGHHNDTRFDARGKVLQEIDPLSQTITYTYDANGNVLTVTDAEGRVITNAYDALDRKTRVTDALGNYEEYTYNDQGLLASRRDALGQVTQYAYDALGQMTSVIDPDGAETRAAYDANGNLASTTDRQGQTTAYTYDELDRLTLLTDAIGRQWSFTYDANGNRLTRTLPSGQTISYAYDNLDRVTAVTYPGGPTVTYTYDANGNRLTMTDANGTTRYTYDERNRLTAVTDAFGNPVAYGYDPAGQLQQLTYPGNRTVAYSHDAAGRLAGLTDWLGHTTGYTRDRTGAVTAIQYGNGARVTKGYDAVGRLTSLINRSGSGAVISSHTLTLDGLGNPLSSTGDLPVVPSNLGRSADLLYDASNRLTSVNGAAITHDEDGRTTADASGSAAIQYAYNAQDLITSVTAGGVITDRYTYDGDGRRVARTSGTPTTRYVLDPTGGDLYSLLAETDGSNNPLRYYVYGDGLVSQITGSSHRYYHFDQTGNTLALTNDSGAVTDKYAYEPFGIATAQGSSYNPFRFVGKYGVMDDGNGLNQMRARYYRPDLARFVSLDSLYGGVADPMSLNRYAYVSGNPMVGVDPSGKACTGVGSTTDSPCTQSINATTMQMTFVDESFKLYDNVAGINIFNAEAKLGVKGDYVYAKANASLFTQIDGEWIEIKLPSADLRGCGSLHTPDSIFLDFKIEICAGAATPSGPTLLIKMVGNGILGLGFSGDAGPVAIKVQAGFNIDPLMNTKPVKQYFNFEKWLKSAPDISSIRAAFGF